MSQTTYFKKNIETKVNRAKDYYENNKEVLREKAKNKYRELPEEKKNTKREYGRNMGLLLCAIFVFIMFLCFR